MKKLILPIYFIVAGLLLILGPHLIFEVCAVTAEKTMKCHYTALVISGAGVLLVISGILSVFAKTVREKLFGYIIAAVAGFASWIYPYSLIGGCGMESMPCRSTTFPATYAIAIITIVIAILAIVLLAVKSSKQKADIT